MILYEADLLMPLARVAARPLAVSGLILVVTLILLDTVVAQTCTSPCQPVTPSPIVQYGVVTLHGSATLSQSYSTITIQIFTTAPGAFYVERIFLMLNAPVQSDLVLQSISIDGVYSYSFSTSYLGPGSAIRVVVLPTGGTIGDIITGIQNALPTSFGFLVVKDPLQNNAVVASGGTNGLSFGVTYSNLYVGGTVQIMALVVAPTGSPVTMTV